MADEELELKAQLSLQEYDDAVENLDPKFRELGRKCIAALDELIRYWNKRPESPNSQADSHAAPDPASGPADNDMAEYVERQLEWAQHERERVLAQLSEDDGARRAGG
jgi:hypothetical protein